VHASSFKYIRTARTIHNNDNFSPDGQWLVYDTRKEDGGIRMGQTIERVHIRGLICVYN